MKHPALRPLCLVAALALPGIANAALPPYWDRIEQIEAILQSPALSDALHREPIKHLSLEGSRSDGALIWRLESETCTLILHLIPVPPTQPGPTRYKLEPPAACK
ncbi:hypothetical protein U5922_003710 [Aquicoccus sp. G2-2]|uniref:hypothetical protein n=1 Tax=Aquicoccus sp. G2-2 TaxID=3092120 RepID=UPI002ADFAB18|nr:hypothetical protein [Aquicoccus sp. G2-2]MEA1112619.1 hypothetical protein [Aquicoccus sp. G2-2]